MNTVITRKELLHESLEQIRFYLADPMILKSNHYRRLINHHCDAIIILLNHFGAIRLEHVEYLMKVVEHKLDLLCSSNIAV